MVLYLLYYSGLLISLTFHLSRNFISLFGCEICGKCGNGGNTSFGFVSKLTCHHTTRVFEDFSAIDPISFGNFRQPYLNLS